MQLYVLSLVYDTHATAAELLDDAVVRDGLTDHWRRKSYVCETGKSMKGVELAVSEKNYWRKIAITLTDQSRDLVSTVII
jgi:hypothetical protein